MKRWGSLNLWGGAFVVASTLAPFTSWAGELVPYEGLKEQFTISLPGGWSVYNQSEVVPGEQAGLGMVFFSAQPLTKPGDKTADVDLLAKADTGEIPTFFVDRQAAGKGMTCGEFSRAAGGHVAGMVRNDPVISEGREVATQFLPKKIELGGCQGFKVEMRAKHSKPEKVEWVVDVRAVSDGKVLYLFSLRTTADHYKEMLGTFESALATFRLSSTQ